MSLNIGVFSSQNMNISGKHSLKKGETDFFVFSPDKNVCAGSLPREEAIVVGAAID